MHPAAIRTPDDHDRRSAGGMLSPVSDHPTDGHPTDDRVGDDNRVGDADGTPESRPAGPAPSVLPRLPGILLDPRPVVAAGLVVWAVATAVIALTDGAGSDLLPICYAGLVIGAVGTVIFLVQRRGARSGRKGAQHGLG